MRKGTVVIVTVGVGAYALGCVAGWLSASRSAARRRHPSGGGEPAWPHPLRSVPNRPGWFDAA